MKSPSRMLAKSPSRMLLRSPNRMLLRSPPLEVASPSRMLPLANACGVLRVATAAIIMIAISLFVLFIAVSPSGVLGGFIGSLLSSKPSWSLSHQRSDHLYYKARATTPRKPTEPAKHNKYTDYTDKEYLRHAPCEQRPNVYQVSTFHPLKGYEPIFGRFLKE